MKHIAVAILLSLCTASAAPQFFGAVLNHGTDPNQTYKNGTHFETYFNWFKEDASLGWDQLQPNPNTFTGGTLSACKADYDYAKSKGFPYFYHFALYRQSGGVPAWVVSLSPAVALAAWKAMLQGVRSSLPNPDQIEVYNEPIHTVPPANIKSALGGDGATGWDWLINAFKIVKEIWPNAKLGVNEWGSELTTDASHGPYIALIQKLEAAGVLDWYGLEAYFGTGFPNQTVTSAQLRSGLDDYESKTKSLIYITEFSPVTSDDNLALAITQAVIPVVMADNRIGAVSIYNPDYEGHWFTSTGYTTAFQWMAAHVPLPLKAASPTPSPDKSRLGN